MTTKARKPSKVAVRKATIEFALARAVRMKARRAKRVPS
jgi:hypothetical protein